MRDKSVSNLLKGNEEMLNFRLALDNMRQNLPLFIDYMTTTSTLHRAKFLALKSEGFNDTEALELCKKLF